MTIPPHFAANDPDAWHALGNLFFDTGRLDDAFRGFEFAAARDMTRSHGET